MFNGDTILMNRAISSRYLRTESLIVKKLRFFCINKTVVTYNLPECLKSIYMLTYGHLSAFILQC